MDIVGGKKPTLGILLKLCSEEIIKQHTGRFVSTDNNVVFVCKSYL